jgi:hypothetical protein
MSKKPQGRTWHKAARTKSAKLTRGAVDKARCADFQARLMAGGTVREHAKEMKIAVRTAYRWAATVQLAAAEWLRREGFNEARLIQAWLDQATRSRGHVLNSALKEIGSILDVYPAKKEPPPALGHVSVIFNTNIEQYKEHRYAPREILVQGSVPNEPQGNAGSGTPAGGISGSRVLDAAKSTEQAKT